MRRLLLAIAVLVLAAPGLARAQSAQQMLVDRATLAAQDIVATNVSRDPLTMLRRARAVMICPRVFKAGFFFGGAGGSCVLLARAGNGTWSYPAFYGIASGSFGLQIGVEDSSIMMMVMTARGLNAVLDSQFKLGVGAGLAIATIGAGVQGSTTAAVGADIVAFSLSRGVFGGVSLEGSIMTARSGWNQAYYGQPYAARQIVIQMQGANRGADPLREVLTRYGSAPMPVSTPPSYRTPPYQRQPTDRAAPAQAGTGYAPAYPPLGPNPPPRGQAPVQLRSHAPVRQQTLPPPG